MAALNDLNNYLRDVLGITSMDVRMALNNQGSTSYNDFLSLKEDDITEICSIARKPGEVFPNPAFNRQNRVPGIAPTVPI